MRPNQKLILIEQYGAGTFMVPQGACMHAYMHTSACRVAPPAAASQAGRPGAAHLCPLYCPPCTAPLVLPLHPRICSFIYSHI